MTNTVVAGSLSDQYCADIMMLPIGGWLGRLISVGRVLKGVVLVVARLAGVLLMVFSSHIL